MAGAQGGAEGVLAALVDAVVVLDNQLQITWTNPAGARLLAREVEEIIGRPALDFVHEPDRIDGAERLATLLGGIQPSPVSLRLVRADGRLLWVEVFGSPVPSAVEESAGGPRLVLSIRDVGWRKSVELGSLREVGWLDLLVAMATRFLELRPGRVDDVVDQVLADLGRVLEASSVSLHEVNAPGDRVTARSRWVRRGMPWAGVSVPIGEPVAVDRLTHWLAAVAGRSGSVELRRGALEHDELADVEPVTTSTIVSVGLRSGERLSGVLTVGWAEPESVSAELRSFLDRAGVLLGLVTTRERARVELAEREAFFRELFEDNSAVMYLVDPVTLRVVDANRAAVEYLGYPLERLRGMDLHELTVHDADELRRLIDRARADGRSVIEDRQRLASGEERDVEVRSTRIRLGERELDLAIVADVTERHQAEAELRRLADTDDLTGALVRRRFLEVAEEELVRSRRYGRPVSLLMVDLDHFKTINDRFGHRTGDEALVAFVATCRRMLRAPDRLGRLGGEEFAVLLPETGATEAAALGARLLEVVRGIEVPGVPEVRLTVSIGLAGSAGPLPAGDVTGREPDPVTVDALLRSADRRLYLAKRSGRDRLVVSDDI